MLSDENSSESTGAGCPIDFTVAGVPSSKFLDTREAFIVILSSLLAWIVGKPSSLWYSLPVTAYKTSIKCGGIQIAVDNWQCSSLHPISAQKCAPPSTQVWGASYSRNLTPMDRSHWDRYMPQEESRHLSTKVQFFKRHDTKKALFTNHEGASNNLGPVRGQCHHSLF